MLRSVLALGIGIAALGFTAIAAEKPAAKGTKTFEGKLVCAKCTLAETDACMHALIVKEGKKEVTYYVDDKKANHSKVCPSGSELAVKVTGKLAEKDGKKWIMMAKVEEVK